MSEYKLVINEAPEDIVDVDTNASAQQEQKKKRRILSVDIIRSWCLLCMVFDHAIVYLSYKARPDGRLIESYDILDFLGMNLAPSFLFLSGASTTLSSKSKIPFVQGLWRALVRFLFLFACEAILTAFCVSLDNMFDILSCMAFSALVTFFCSYLTPSGMSNIIYIHTHINTH